jgi:hypothetical protein
LRPSTFDCARSARCACDHWLADDDNESCLVMQDIEGNEFCLD